MKQTQCSDCKRIREVEDDVLMTTCLCGNTLNFNRKGVLTNDLHQNDQVILKEVFQIGVSKGRPLSIQQVIDSLDTRIRVNLK